MGSTARHSLVVLADVGGENAHVGDEAMLRANLQRLRACVPEVAVTVLGRDADHDDIALAMSGATGALISGGGNLSSTWPALLEQRVELVSAAARLGLPVVAGGQTIGPELTDPQRSELAGALGRVALTGVRELPSAALARELGVPAERLVYQVDDAFGLAAAPPARGTPGGVLGEPYLAVTLDASFGVAQARAGLQAIAAQLASAAVEAGLAIVFVPHVGPVGEVGDEDGLTGMALAELVRAEGAGCTLAPVQPPAQTAWLTQHAAAVVSSRYHPLVFATAGAVPCLGIHQDAYTRIKLEGALAHVGLKGWCLSAADAQDGGLEAAFHRLWAQRDEVRRTMVAARPGVDRRDARRWRVMLGRLGLVNGEDYPLGAASAGILVNRIEERAMSVHATDRAIEPISDEQWDGYLRNGFMPLGEVLTLVEVDALRQRADDLAMGLTRNDHVQMQLDTGGAYEDLPGVVPAFEQGTMLYRKIQGLEADPLFLPLVRHPRFLEVCAQVYGAHAPVSIFRAMIMNKPAGQGTVLPWHQDGGDVWALDRDPLVTIWVALDPATVANGCMEAVPGSHRLGLLSATGSTVSEVHAAQHCPPERVRPLEVPPGHAILLHNWLIHRSGVNPSPVPRRAVTVCYMDGRTRSVVTGDHFPIVAGSLDPTPDPYVRQLSEERDALRASFAEAAEYARSLEVERRRLEALLTDGPACPEPAGRSRLGTRLRRPFGRSQQP